MVLRQIDNFTASISPATLAHRPPNVLVAVASTWVHSTTVQVQAASAASTACRSRPIATEYSSVNNSVWRGSAGISSIDIIMGIFTETVRSGGGNTSLTVEETPA